MVQIPSSKLVASSPLEKVSAAGTLPESMLAMDRKEKLSFGEGSDNILKASWNSMDHHTKPWSSSSVQPASYSLVGNRPGNSATQWESSLFSSSFSDAFSAKCKPSFL